MAQFSERTLAWQLYLRAHGARIACDGVYGPKTKAATAEMQLDLGVQADGLLGPITIAAARKAGFRPPSWPDKPDGAVPFNATQRRKSFGAYAFVPAPTSDDPEAIRITDGWEEKNIVRVQIPELANVKGAPKLGVPFHRLAAAQLKRLFSRWHDAGLVDRILTWDGSFVPRMIRGRSSLSMHAYGAAFDINCEFNPLGGRPALMYERGCVRELVEIAWQFGFYWGGWFSRRDGMHFEVNRILE